MKRKRSPSPSDRDAKRVKRSTLADIVNLLKTGKMVIKGRKLCTVVQKITYIDELIGLEDLKMFVADMIFSFVAKLPGRSQFHNISVTGPAGSGKTEVCIRMAGLFQYLLFNVDSPVVVLSRADLVGQYLGETAIKTRAALTRNKSRFLFIDEVYSLGNSGNDRDSYSKEALDTLCNFMSENCSSCAVIVAGYPQATQACFFDLNSGFDRRFPWKFQMGLYKPDELVEIFKTKFASFTFEDTQDLLEFFRRNKAKQAAEALKIMESVRMIQSRKVCTNLASKYRISKSTLVEAISCMKQVVEDGPPEHFYI
jgi:SpoVK/Ycf46/Vps4 family AAA+-type ATPase